MAVSAKFIADFTQFQSAVDKAELKLRDFSSGIGRVDKDLAKFGNQFSGVKIIQESALITKAVEEIGGAAKLTQREQARVNAITSEAIEKYQRLGQEAPAALKALHDATIRVEKPTRDLTTRMVALGAAVGTFIGNFAADMVRQGVQALVSMGREAFESAGKILDLSNKTGESTAAIQRMRFVADQTGTSLEAMTASAFQLRTRLAGGNASVVAALRELTQVSGEAGLSTRSSADQIFSALSKITDQQTRTRLGTELMGRSFGNVAAAITEGYDQIADGARLSSDEQLKALDAASDRWSSFVQNTKAGITSFLGDLVLAIDKWREFGKAQQDALREGSIFNQGPGAAMLQRFPAQPGDAGAPASTANVNAGATALRNYAQELAAVRKEVLSLTPAQREQILAAQRLGVDTEELSQRFDVSTDALRMMSDVLRTVNQDTKVLQATFAKGLRTPEIPDFMALANAVPGRLDSRMQSRSVMNLLARAVPSIPLIPNAAGPQSRMFMSMANAMPGRMFSGNASFPPQRGFFGTIGGGIGGSLSNMWRGMSGGQGMAGLFSNIGGGILTGGLTTLMNTGISLLGKGIAKLFGSGEGRKTNDLRDQAISDRFGTSDNLRQMAARAGVSLEAFFKAKTVKDFEKAMADVEARLESVNELLQKYNITLADFHGVEQTRRLNEAIKSLTDDFDALIRQGVEHERAVRAVGPAYYELALAAVKAGRDIPGALAPVLRDLARMGQLTNEQAAALLGLGGDAGPTWQSMEYAAKKYNIELGKLGDRFRQLKLNDLGKDLAKDFELLLEGGAPIDELLKGMSEEVQALVTEALKGGLSIPASMRPILEHMVRQGRLTDEAGQKLEDLGRIWFADPVMSEVDRLIAKLDELIDKIGSIPAINVPVNSNAFDVPAARADAYEIPSLAVGGRITRSGLALVHSGETVVPAGAGGGGTHYHTWNVSAFAHVDRELIEDQMLPRLIEGIEKNRHGSRTRATKLTQRTA